MGAAWVRQHVWAGRRVMWCLLLGSGIGGCETRGPPLADVDVTDSAGVRVVRFSTLASINAPTVVARRSFRTDPGETVLFNLEDGVFLADGSLLLANLGTSELVLIDRDGKEIRRIGGRGEGPGEYRWPSWLEVVDDNVWVYDKGQRRLTVLGPELQVLATRNFSVGDDPLIPLAPLTIAGDTVVAIHGSSGHVRSSGEARDTTPLLRVSASGSLDTIGLWPAEERAFVTIPQGRLLVPIVFGRRVVASGQSGRVVIGSTGAARVQTYDRAGSLEVIYVASLAPQGTLPTDAEAYRNSLLAHLPMNNPDVAAAWGRAPVRETVPPLGALVMDDEGRVWMAATVRPGQKRRLWVVFDVDGAPSARVELPTQFWPWPVSTEILDVSRGRVAIRFRGDYDEEYVEVWEFRQPM